MGIENQENILQALQRDLDGAQTTNEQVVNIVNAWSQLINGSGQETKQGQAPFQLNDVKRQIESALPSLTDPFVSNSKVVSIEPKSAEGVEKATVLEKLINYQFDKGIDTVEFIENCARNLMAEGTVFTKVGWKDDMPTVELIQIGELLLDPSARSMNDLNFAIQRRKVSISSILSNPDWYGEHTLDSLSVIEAVSATQYDDFKNDGYGFDSSYNFEDRARELVEVFEYYGSYDINGTGIATPILAIWSGNTMLKIIESPYPESWRGIPFESAVYIRRPYSVYGDGVVSLSGDYQIIRTAIMREVVKNAASASNGTVFLKKGALDIPNAHYLNRGAKAVELNGIPSQLIAHSPFNEIPSSTFSLLETFKIESEEITGISRNNAGFDGRAMNNTTATSARIVQSNAESRLLQTTRHVSSMLEGVFRKWIDLNQMMLQNGSVKIEDRFVPVSSDMIDGSYDLKVTAGTSGKAQQKVSSVTMMLQQLIPMANEIDKSIIYGMLAEMSDAVDMPVVAEELRQMATNPKQPDPQQTMIQLEAMMLEQQAKQASIAKDNAQAMKYQSEAFETRIDAERASYGL